MLGGILLSHYPNLFHTYCLAHLLHNCAARVKNYFPSVDRLIGAIKNAVVKNKSRANEFRNEVGWSHDGVCGFRLSNTTLTIS